MIGNEPNQPRFWMPQFSPDGKPLAAAQYVPVLAASYDALKAVDPTINVIGIGLSPRGNDQPFAKSNASRSPVRFLHDLGVAYRASGRTKPLMDELAFHPYPQPQQGPPSTRYAWPTAGLAEPRPDQAGGLGRVQRHRRSRPSPKPATTAVQAAEVRPRRGRLAGRAAAGAGVALHRRRDAPARSRSAKTTRRRTTATRSRSPSATPACACSASSTWSTRPTSTAGRAGSSAPTARTGPSYDAIKQTLAQTHGNCPTTPVAWRHLTTVVLPTAAWGSLKPQPLKRSRWSFGAGAGEEADFKAGIFKAGPPKTVLGKRLAAGRPKPLLSGRAA